jgi:hypothetical protein
MGEAFKKHLKRSSGSILMDSERSQSLESEYRSLPDYPDVEVNCFGDVRWKSGKSIKIYYCDRYDSHYLKLFYSLRDPQEKNRSISMFNLVAKLFVDNPAGYKFVQAKNGNNSDYRADNLEWVKCRRRKDKIGEEEDC